MLQSALLNFTVSIINTGEWPLCTMLLVQDWIEWRFSLASALDWLLYDYISVCECTYLLLYAGQWWMHDKAAYKFATCSWEVEGEGGGRGRGKHFPPLNSLSVICICPHETVHVLLYSDDRRWLLASYAQPFFARSSATEYQPKLAGGHRHQEYCLVLGMYTDAK